MKAKHDEVHGTLATTLHGTEDLGLVSLTLPRDLLQLGPGTMLCKKAHGRGVLLRLINRRPELPSEEGKTQVESLNARCMISSELQEPNVPRHLGLRGCFSKSAE